MSESVKRLLCQQCSRPLRTCICAFITPLSNRIELLLLQHPLEVHNAKNTLGLLRLSLKNNQTRIGEIFDAAELDKWLYTAKKTPVLLYPVTPEDTSLGLKAAPPLSIDILANPDNIRLVILDGTWRKSRKMLYLNPALQTLPRLALHTTPQSIYTIRKAHSENQLSTLEASCYALQQLEHARVDYSPLLAAFRRFIAQQSTFVPNHDLPT